MPSARVTVQSSAIEVPSLDHQHWSQEHITNGSFQGSFQARCLYFLKRVTEALLFFKAPEFETYDLRVRYDQVIAFL